MSPLVSICIPAYKRTSFLKRLLDSISFQSFRDFEVVVTDDTPGNEVKDLCELYKSKFSLHYFKNPAQLGTPENWNESIRHANGEWIKMMHDDDWFASENGLLEFADAAAKNPESSFIFSGFSDVDADNARTKKFVISQSSLRKLRKSSLYLFKKNFIGHPSTTLIKNKNLVYDKNIKWVVDFEFYMRYLNDNPSLIAIRKPLINIGISESQVTKEAFRNPLIEIPEVLYLYHKLPPKSFRNIFVYDYYWRFIRNLGIRKTTDIQKYLAPGIEIPGIIKRMLTFQARWPLKLLKNGFVSKGLMSISYLTNYNKL